MVKIVAFSRENRAEAQAALDDSLSYYTPAKPSKTEQPSLTPLEQMYAYYSPAA
jgi:hypothetical protein